MNKTKTKQFLWPVIFSLSIFLSFQFLEGGGKLNFLNNKVFAWTTSPTTSTSTTTTYKAPSTSTTTAVPVQPPPSTYKAPSTSTTTAVPVPPPPTPIDLCDPNPCPDDPARLNTQLCRGKPDSLGNILICKCCPPEPDYICGYSGDNPICISDSPSKHCQGNLVQAIPSTITEEQCINQGGSIFYWGGSEYCCSGPSEWCGNGIVEAPEECEPPNSHNNTSCAGYDCDIDCKCKYPPCGNGVIDPGEQCEPPNTLYNPNCSGYKCGNNCQCDRACNKNNDCGITDQCCEHLCTHGVCCTDADCINISPFSPHCCTIDGRNVCHKCCNDSQCTQPPWTNCKDGSCTELCDGICTPAANCSRLFDPCTCDAPPECSGKTGICRESGSSPPSLECYYDGVQP